MRVDLVTLLTTKEAARRLRLSSERVRQLVHRGSIEAQTTPLGFFFDPAEVERVRRQRLKSA